jgi:gamma-tubulin complex component 3
MSSALTLPALDARRAVLLLQGFTDGAQPSAGPSSASSPAWRALEEAGALFASICAFLDDESLGGAGSLAGTSRRSSLLRQAFAAAVRAETDAHLRDLAAVESDMARSGGAGAGAGAARAPWTVRRVSAWCAGHVRRLRAVGVLVDACRGAEGAHLLTTLWAAAQNGDPDARDVAHAILAAALQPLAAACTAWARGLDVGVGVASVGGSSGGAGGASSSSSSSFFFCTRGAAAAAAGSPAPSAADPWRAYALDPSRVPAFLPAPLAARLFSCGRTLRFIREACKDEAWVAELAKKVAAAAEAEEKEEKEGDGSSAAAGRGGGGDSDPAAAFCALVERDVALLGPIAEARLLFLLKERFGLLSHLAAVHRYVLLAQGDFASDLVTAAAAELRKPAGVVSSSRHVLDAILESAIRSSNARLDDRAVVDRISVRFLPPAGGGGGKGGGGGAASSAATGWDVFALEYIVDPPLSTIIDRAGRDALSECFRFVWQIRRCENELNAAWGELSRLQQEAGSLVSASARAASRRCLHGSHLLRADMLSFVTSLLTHVVYDVLSPAWTALHDGVDGAADLDAVVAAYAAYLAASVRGLFLPHLQDGSEGSEAGTGAPNAQAAAAAAAAAATAGAAATASARACIGRALSSVLEFVEGQRRYGAAVRLALRRAEEKRGAKAGAGASWGDDEEEEEDGGVADEVIGASAAFARTLEGAGAGYRGAVADLYAAAAAATASTAALADKLGALLSKYDFSGAGRV